MGELNVSTNGAGHHRQLHQYLLTTIIESPDVILAYDGDAAGARAIWRHIDKTNGPALNDRTATDWELDAQREHWLRVLVDSPTTELASLASSRLRLLGTELARRQKLGYDRAASPYEWTGAIASVRAKADLLGIFGSRRPDTVAGRAIRTSGRVTHIRCPFHTERSPSLAVYDDNHWYCYGCQSGGDAIDAVQRLEGLGFCAAVESLAREYGIDLPRPGPGIANGHRVIRT